MCEIVNIVQELEEGASPYTRRFVDDLVSSSMPPWQTARLNNCVELGLTRLKFSGR
jgi:hypothetical protein